MIGSGSLIIVHPKGWSCAREAEVDIEFDIRPDNTAKKTMIVNIKGLFDSFGEVTKGIDVKGIFKYDTDMKICFNATLLTRAKLVINGELNNNFETIFKEIKSWQEYYKAN